MQRHGGSVSLYFEDYEVGDTFKTAARTVDQSDINLFAGISGDFHGLHTNEEFAKKTLFGRRVAHGILTLAITSGLMMRLGIFVDTGLGNLGETVKYVAPVFPGDTISAELEVLSMKPVKGKKRGIVRFSINTLNQDNKIVVTHEMDVLVMCRE
jgi:acyl dehydratase